MTTLTKAALIGVAISLAFLTGRYLAPEKVRTVEVEKKVVEKETKKEIHEVTKKVVHTNPDGSTTEETTTTKDTNVDRNTTATTDKNKDTEKSYRGRFINLGVLGAYDISKNVPSFGIYANTTLVGPITGGVWGLNNGTGGVALGVEF